MKIVLALAVFAASASAIAEEAPRTSKPSRVPFVCANSGEKVAGLNKICYYNCVKIGWRRDGSSLRSLPALEATLEAQSERPIRTKRKVTVVEGTKDEIGDPDVLKLF